MASQMNIFLFGDQASDYHDNLRSKIHQKSHPLLTSFLERTTIALRQEVAQQPHLIRNTIPSFTSLLELVDWFDDVEVSNPAMESALCCITQVACLLSYYETNSDFIDASNTLLIGSCTGLLGAIVASCSRGVSDVPVLGAIMVKLAFRIGVSVAGARDWLQAGPNKRKSWAGVVPMKNESDLRDALEAFLSEERISASDRGYFSAVGYQSATISGPPSTLQKMADSTGPFKNVGKVSLPIHGPYHADHLYNESSVEKLIQPFWEDLTGFRPRVSILSTSTGEVLSAPTASELTQHAIAEILCNTLYWNRVIEGAVTQVQDRGITACTIFPVSSGIVAKGLVTALEKNSQCVTTTDTSIWMGSSESLATHQPSGHLQDSKIAIVGMSGRFPNADSNEAFWKLLESGIDTHKIIPSDRFDSSHVDPEGKRKNTSHTPYGCFIDEPGNFDARFFSMSPREATTTDPTHRLAILTAYEALEQSGYTPNRTPSTQLHRIGTFYGQTSDDWREIQDGQDIDTYFIPGGVRAFGPGRINYFFKFSGPSYSVDTACSSSFTALQLAVTSLRAGECDTAITGGMNVMTNPDIFSGLSRGQFLSRTGNCQTFDNEADGYCRGEAVASVILKRLEDAKADKDNILGVILGSATNHSAEAVSITHPHAGAQSYLYRQILDKAAIDPNDVSYVEMHGTGTQAGDHIEMDSVTSVFAARHRKRKANQTLNLGAVKANIGHGEAASGVCALIKVLMMMEKSQIPPNCGIKRKINQSFPKDLKQRNVHIPVVLTPWWRPPGGKRRAFISNFSAAGGNTGVILEDAPEISEPECEDPRSAQIVAVTGKSKSALIQNCENLLSYIKENPDTSLSSLSYTTTARRNHYNNRIAVCETSLAKVKDSLKAAIQRDNTPITPTKPRVAFVFTGQGSHYAALGKQLYEESSQFRSDILHFNGMAQNQGLPSFLPLIDGSSQDTSVLSPVVIQLGSTCVQMALARLWSSWGITPSVVLGHSLGEYAALYYAGVLSASDAIHLVGERAHELETHCTPDTHAMLAVADSVASVESRFAQDPLEIACINSPNETVIGGSREDIDEKADILSKDGVRSTKLRIPYAFHISQVDPILESYEGIANGVTFNAPTIPVISPLLGEIVREEGIFDPKYVTRHARETVNFPSGIEAGINDGVINDQTVWIEIGPHPVCLSMIRKMLGTKIFAVPSLRRNEDAWKTISEGLASLYNHGLDFNWQEFQRDFNASQRMLRLPRYAFDLKKFWIQYTGNWCLTKGSTSAREPVQEAKPKILTTSVQRIVEESQDEKSASVVVESDISEPTLQRVVRGHQVNDTSLCPSSFYADVALSVGGHLFATVKPDDQIPAMNVGKMEVDKPLIAKGDKAQLLRVSGVLDKSTGKVKLRFFSVNAEGQKTIDHAKCKVLFEDAPSLLANWSRIAYLIKPRVQSLLDGVNSGTTEKIHRNMAYELFGTFVKYAPSYRGMENITIDMGQTEATARLSFQTTEEDGQFACPPYWIDSIGHLSGFIVNVKEALGSKANVYVSHGWDSLRLAKPLSKDQLYRTYVKMQPAGDKIMAGDVVLFDENLDAIIGIFGGVKFQSIPRTVLNTFLPPAGGVTKASPKSALPSPSKKSSQPASKVKASAPSPQLKKNSTYVVNRALDIVAGELGVPLSELSDNVVFADIGVDSLMSLTISAQLREQLDLDISQTLFADCPSVKDMKDHFANNSPEPVRETDSPDSSSDGSPDSEDARSTANDGVTTPATSNDGVDTPPTKNNEDDLVEIIRTTVAEEMEIPISEIVGKTSLASLGMDSLMTLQILATLRENTGEDLSNDFFVENPSMEDVENTLNPKSKPTVHTENSSTKSRKAKSTAEPQSTKPKPKAVSLLLQGNPKKASKTLFLTPDGSGSASSYAFISKIDPDVALYGLNCPYMETPQDWTNGIPGAASIYKEEIQRRQPKGPYYLGGWSAGGVLAYEISLQFQKEGERVERLVLIDSPCPVHLEPLPNRLHHFFDEIGLLGTGKGKAPSWLLPHFDSAIRALDQYRPEAMDPSKVPTTLAIWATDGVCGKPDDPKPPPQKDDPWNMKWLLENRTDFGSNGWHELLGEGKMQFAKIGGNHFTLMREPVVQELAAIIRKGL